MKFKLKKDLFTHDYILIIIAVAIGLSVGTLSLLYAGFINFLSKKLYLQVANNYGYIIIALPAIGGLIVGLLIHYGSLTAKGHGVPALLETIKSKKLRLTSKDLWVEGLASALTISTGGSTGRIGPVVEIGAGIGDIIGYKLNFSLELYQIMLGCGAAAGISAIFNAPLGGIMFVIEILFKKLDISKLTLIMISSISADALVRSIVEKQPLFYLPEFYLNNPIEYLFYILLGVITAFIGYIFIKLLYIISNWFEGLHIPYWLKPTGGGLIVGVMGYFVLEILGTGIETINSVLRKDFILKYLLLILILKILATCITLGSGGSGGIFAPGLLLGTVTGLIYGKLLKKIFPFINILPESYGLVGMAALISGIAQAPLTGVLVIFELTRNYNLIIPLLLVSVLSSIISRQLNPDSIYSPTLFHKM